mmetsp:Transcript_100491/g.199575  ORF Transcript_100491/g.199575 Transcript_100491/m.199575 type:complete len:119 (+) Transcript_100491:966-1322(+)
MVSAATLSGHCNAVQQVLYKRWLTEEMMEPVPGPPVAALQMSSDLLSLWSGHSSHMLMQPLGGLSLQEHSAPAVDVDILICFCPALYTHHEVRPVELIFLTKPAFPHTKPNLRGSLLG